MNKEAAIYKPFTWQMLADGLMSIENLVNGSLVAIKPDTVHLQVMPERDGVRRTRAERIFRHKSAQLDREPFEVARDQHDVDMVRELRNLCKVGMQFGTLLVIVPFTSEMTPHSGFSNEHDPIVWTPSAILTSIEIWMCWLRISTWLHTTLTSP